MISIDTNILLYAQNADCPEHDTAFGFIDACGTRDDVAICELVLVEFYLLLRNPAVVKQPLTAEMAADTCLAYRANPRWCLIENALVMDQVWGLARQPGFARRRIFDARIALTLLRHGVTELATANVRDFDGFGFQRVWNPLAHTHP